MPATSNHVHRALFLREEIFLRTVNLILKWANGAESQVYMCSDYVLRSLRVLGTQGNADSLVEQSKDKSPKCLMQRPQKASGLAMIYM